MIDWARVSELRDEIGAEDFNEVVELFLEEVDETIERLPSSPLTELEENMHFLKGSALNLGFARFSRLCEEGEKAAADGLNDTVDVNAVVACYHASRAEFLDHMHMKLSA